MPTKLSKHQRLYRKRKAEANRADYRYTGRISAGGFKATISTRHRLTIRLSHSDQQRLLQVMESLDLNKSDAVNYLAMKLGESPVFGLDPSNNRLHRYVYHQVPRVERRRRQAATAHRSCVVVTRFAWRKLTFNSARRGVSISRWLSQLLKLYVAREG
jgi:hypothetical protein